MAIKDNNTNYDVVNDNPLVTSMFNYGTGTTSLNPPPPSSFMITEITNDLMISEAGDYMITEF